MASLKEVYDAIIIGGGFYGISIATKLAEQGQSVLLLEREEDVFRHASTNNQARVHQGYHYPRHFLTALRSRVNFGQFVRDYKNCIVDSFEKYYAIASYQSKTNALQFQHFMDRVGAPIEEAPRSIWDLFNPQLVEGVFKVQEYAFDAVKLKEMTVRLMESAGVESITGCNVLRVEKDPLRVIWRGNGMEMIAQAARVYNCTYSGINEVLRSSNVPLIDFKHELTEMCLIKPPEELQGKGVTIMCGPFFSVMPFPSRSGLFTLSHVRYTPHAQWVDGTTKGMSNYEILKAPRRTNYTPMIKDAIRYLPCMEGAQYVDSLWEVKTVLQQKEIDDGRPILYKAIDEIPGLTCVLGGKVDNIYDVYSILGE